MLQAMHRPVEGPAFASGREQGDFFETCGRAVGIVLALDESTEPIDGCAGEAERGAAGGKQPVARPLQLVGEVPAVCHAVDACCRAQLNEVFVVAAESMADDVSWVVQTTKRRKNSSPVQVVAIDGAVLLERTREAAGFTMFDVPFGVLELVRGLAGTVIDGYDYAIALDSADVHVSADRIYDLCLEAVRHPEAEAVASLVDGERRSPYLFAREFLEGLEERGFTSADQAGGVPAAVVRDCVFGDD